MKFKVGDRIIVTGEPYKARNGTIIKLVSNNYYSIIVSIDGQSYHSEKFGCLYHNNEVKLLIKPGQQLEWDW